MYALCKRTLGQYKIFNTNYDDKIVFLILRMIVLRFFIDRNKKIVAV